MKLQDLILSKISYAKQSNTGFYQVKCPCCNDYKPRGGFKISDTEVFYSCFNCPSKGGHRTDGSQKTMSKNFKHILTQFGISEQEINQSDSSNFFGAIKETAPSVITIENIQKVNTFTPEVQLPEGSKRIGDFETAPLIQQYLKTRGLTINDYPFFSCSDKSFAKRVIIPYYKQNKIIYWQARSIIPNIEPRYLNCEVPKAAVLFNHDELFRNRDLPLFVCEGVFDAIHLNGIGLLGSTLTDAKIELLQKTQRELVFVIDQDTKGKVLGERVLREKLGCITFAPIANGDATESIVQTGKIWTVSQLLRGRIYDDRMATLKLNFIKDTNVRYRKAKNTY